MYSYRMLQYQYSTQQIDVAKSIHKMLCPQTPLEYSSKDLNHLGAQLRHERKQKIFAKRHPKSQQMTPKIPPK